MQAKNAPIITSCSLLNMCINLKLDRAAMSSYGQLLFRGWVKLGVTPCVKYPDLHIIVPILMHGMVIFLSSNFFLSSIFWWIQPPAGKTTRRPLRQPEAPPQMTTPLSGLTANDVVENLVLIYKINLSWSKSVKAELTALNGFSFVISGAVSLLW